MGARISQAEHDRRVALVAQGLTVPEVAQQLGMRVAAFSNWCRYHKLSVASRATDPETGDARRRALAAQGLTISEAARVLGMRVSTLWNWANRNRVAFRMERQRPAVQGRRISDEARARILQLLAEGLPYPAVAEAVGVSRHSVGRAARVAGLARKLGRPRVRRDTARLPRLRAADLLSRLSGREADDVTVLRERGGYSLREALMSIRRADLVAEVDALPPQAAPHKWRAAAAEEAPPSSPTRKAAA